MIEYIKGKITYISNNKLIIESSGIGFCINTTNFFPLNSEQTIYTYIKKTETEDTIYGFKDIKTKELFLYFLTIKGIGCKVALNIISRDYNEIINALNYKDIEYFTKIPKIGINMATNIVKNYKGNYIYNNDLVNALVSLEYKKSEIYKIIDKIDYNKKIDQQIKDAILLLG